MARARLGGIFDRSATLPFAGGVEREPDGAVFCYRQARRAVISASGVDLLEASPERRRRQLRLFEHLLVGLETPFQLLVTSRPGEARELSAREAMYLESRARERPFYERRTYIILSESDAGAGSGLDQVWSRAQRNWRRPGPARAADLLRRARAVAEVLGAMGLRPQVLEGEALEQFLRLHLPSVLRCISLCAWREHASSLQLDRRLHRSYFLDAYPGVELAGGWLAPLIDVEADYDLSLHGFAVPTDALLRSLNHRIRDLRAQRMADSLAQSVADPLAELGLPDALELRESVASNQQRAFHVSLYVTVNAATAGELEAASRRLEEAGMRTLSTLLPLTFQMAAGRSCTLPLGHDAVDATKLVPSAVLASAFPWLWEELRQAGGRLIGFKLRGGSPVILDSFDEERFSNANIGVFGHSGAGKTFLMKNLLCADAEAGVGAFIIDPEAEYRRLGQALGGQWVDLSLGSGNSINVLDRSLADLGQRDPLGDQVSDLLDLIATMIGQLTEDERLELDEALRTVLQEPGYTLRELRAELERRSAAPRVSRLLRRWTEGHIGELFSAPSNVRLDADIVVFGLRDLKEEVLPVAYFLIAQWIWTRVRSQPRRRRLLFDEVGLLFEHPLVRRFLVRLARRVRKYQGSLCLITQNAGDLLSSDQGLVLATNPAVLFLGAQRQAEAQRLQRAFGLTDDQTEFLAGAPRGQFLLLAGEGRHRIEVAAPPWREELLA